MIKPQQSKHGDDRRRRQRLRCALPLQILLLFFVTSVAIADDVPKDDSAKLPKDLRGEVEAAQKIAGQRNLTPDDVDELFRSAVVEYGNVDPLLGWFVESRADRMDASARHLMELEALIAARTGALRRASGLVNDLLEDRQTFASRFDLRIWQAQLFDSLGKADEARAAYEKLVKEENLDEAQQQDVSLRLALMGLLGQGKSDAKPLIDVAKKSSDIDFRNRAANVLAVQNKYKEAMELFTVQGKETARFRSASRVTEWALRAKSWDNAIKTGWDAVRSAKIKRDRRYALALLVEAYRLKDKKKGLEKLVDEFAKIDKEKKEPLTDDMRGVWISLLRELERYDDAIKLFREGTTGGFNVEMRRELLEMQGEAGREDAMLASYRKLIEAEPNQLVWRRGLTRVLLEKGNDKAARALWTDYISRSVDGPQLLLSAQSLGDVGLDDLAAKTVGRMVQLKAEHGKGLLYLADLQQRRGKLEESEATLNQLNGLADAGDVVRFELAAAFERVGRQDKAVEVIEAIRSDRKEIATDLEMRLAWLYSETGDEEKALAQWLSLWRETKSVARRRYVEDRLMTVASRLGTLGEIAVDLEVKLLDGKADDREAGLLTRIYSRVNDSVAASEVLEEYMTQSGKQEVERLQEKARIYQVCNDYWNYEKVIEQLVKVDPEGETDYLRQLALSMLERGKAQEARKVLLALRDSEEVSDDIGGEFEAGVLSLVGMKPEAADAYRRGIAKHPDRIESYLLLANLLRDLGQSQRAVGMFQYLAETAEKDDLFTIAIDGILNMRANPKALQWARRITLQRLAGRDDKNYLYQLLSDLSEEVNDKNGQIRALENSLAVSGTRRQQILRECMDLSSRIRGGVFYSSSSRGPTNAGNKPFFAFGRRLIGLGELMPPQVFLDLGQAFLDDGDVGSAERTFMMARNQSDEQGYERNVAQIFEKAGRKKESLERYDRLLRTSPSDVALIARVAKLNEQLGNDAVAARFYRRGFNLLLAQTPLTTLEEEDENATGYYWARNQDAYDKYSAQLLRGLLVTIPGDQIDEMLAEQQAKLTESLTAVEAMVATGRTADQLSDSPRIEKRSIALRRMLFAFDRIDALQDIDLALLRRFSKDTSLLANLTKARIDRGEFSSARDLLRKANASDDVRKRFAAVLGVKMADPVGATKLAPKEMWQQLLPLWLKGDRAGSLRILRRLDQRQITGSNIGQTVTYVYTGGAPTYKQAWASDVFILTQLSLTLGDRGLALQFARSRLQNATNVTGPIYGDPATTLLRAFKSILPAEEYESLCRFALNKFKDDESNGMAYLWLVNQVKGEALTNEQMLAKIEELKIGLDYRFTYQDAVEMFPESLLDKALWTLIDNTDQKMVAGPLAAIPFTSQKPLSDKVAKVIAEGVAEGIPAAMKDNYLAYCTSRLPGRYVSPNAEPPPIVQNRANAKHAIAVLDQFATKEIKASQVAVANRALGLKSLLLKELGKTDEAVALALELYDPKRNITDYYERYTWERVKREVFPLAPNKFLAKAVKPTKGKPTVKDTDERLRFIIGLNDEEAIRAEYETAWKTHPNESKYPRDYKRWEQRAGRTMNVLAIDERLYAAERRKQETPKDAADAKRKAAAQATKLRSMSRSLASMWLSAGHPVNGLKHFVVNDDRDAQRFEEEKTRRGKTADTSDKRPGPGKPAAPSAETPSTTASTPAIRMQPATSSSAVRVVPAARVAALTATVAQARGASSSKPSTRPKTVNDLKKAVEAKKSDEARQILRELWREFPPVQEGPYRIYSRGNRANMLRWPSTPKPAKTPTTKPKQLTDEEKEKAAEEARKKAEETKKKIERDRINRLRGGLATLDVPPRKRTIRPTPPTVWTALADNDFVADEMERILRSRDTSELGGISEIIAGILKRDRSKRGDKAVFDSLMQRLRDGRAGAIHTSQLLMMLKDKPDLVGKNAEQVIDELTNLLDLDQAPAAMQLAQLCVKSGLKDRGAALFAHCASRASDRDIYGTNLNISFSQLLTEAKTCFEGEELFQLVEQMFELTPVKSDPNVTTVLELRREQLDPKTAADRSEPFFGALDKDPAAIRVAPSIWGALIFAEAGNMKRARQCLRSAATRGNSAPDDFGIRMVERRLNRVEYLRMFPKDAKRFANYNEWLTIASAEIAKLFREGVLKRSQAVEMQLIVAHRQVTNGNTAGAGKTLASVQEGLGKDKSLRLLAIDVLREAGMTPQALKLQRQLFDAGTLSYVRYGDLLADTGATDGKLAASSLFETLTQRSLDDSLLASADGLVEVDRLAALKSAAASAREEYDARKKAAATRAQERSAWRKADAEKRKAAAKKAAAEKAKGKKGDQAKPPVPKP